MRERKVVEMVESQLDRAGLYHVNVVGAERSDSGTPDILATAPGGGFLAIECKAEGREPFPTQYMHLTRVLLGGGRAVVAYPDFSLAAIADGTVPTCPIGRDWTEAPFGFSLPQRRATVELVLAERGEAGA